MNIHTTRAHLLATTVLVGAIVASTAPAMAQSAPAAQDEATEVEEVVVTGSRIRRDPTTAPTPLIQVSREQLLTTGQNTVIDYLATIPALSNSQVPSDTVGSLNSGGLSLPNLRSLGAGRTLTLVDGRRHVGSAAGSLSVDVDTIPRLLIQSVEIVTGGASSVYGADAVSGVLNFILRKDFEGLEIDANYGMINQDGQTNERVSFLAGKNLFDDRLNVYAFGEYERLDEVLAPNVDWLREGWGLVGRDVDPSAAAYDGVLDAELFSDRRTLQIVRFGQVTLASQYQPSPTSDPDVGVLACTSYLSAGCYGVAPGRTYVFDGTAARLANFGTLLSRTGTNQSINTGGDGENPNTIFNVDSTLPESRSARFQTGATFALTDNINLFAEAKYVSERTNLATGYGFADVYISDNNPANAVQPILSARTAGPTIFTTRLDNAFLPANLRAAIQSNVATIYGAPTANAPGAVTSLRASPWARYSAWTLDRPQENQRDLQRYVIGANGELGDFGPLRDVAFDIGYTYGRVDNTNAESSNDGERLAYALDSIVDTAGTLGTPGAIVCRVRLLTANGGRIANQNLGGTATYGSTDPIINTCVPLNIFGLGNQSAAGLDYVRSTITIEQQNEQHDLAGSLTGQLWDFWGAGSIGVAIGGEYRKELTEGTGRNRTTAGRWLLSNTGPDFLPAEYDVSEFFGEVSVPLFRDSFLGTYAELSASYRQSDYSTVGKTDVSGFNLVYRPVPELALKTSFNTSVRVPSLGESFAPLVQTFALLTDPCDARVINNLTDRTIANQRIANCGTLAREAGLNFDFASSTTANAYLPVYTSSVPGRNGGNPFLQPEESDSFTFSIAYQPPIIPNLSLVLDYYEIEITDVIAAVTAQTAANNCVSGPTINASACATLTRSPVDLATSPADDRFLLVDFIQGSINYAKRTTRGLDFSARYSLDTAEMWDRNWGTFNYSVNGSWLIEQKNFNNIDNRADFTESASLVFFPRVRLTSSLTWAPNEIWSVNWTMDWQTAQDIVQRRDFVNNADSRDSSLLDTGNFARNDFTLRWNVRDNLSIRTGVVNAFDAEQADVLGSALTSNFDPYGRRVFIGLNYRPW
ncbi:MAG: TonB-dependent receptor [Brevundimonas sp.]|uniref:TonB-dependent receptor domain-containing protein n=1 Tax=Brevundimonas sp. TaxID=1871086 RepID=UPI002734B85B|nr:TonB-dependent receptor [Brevundimonas sp.]MDP3406205.1 TonB-dependent receptor [Brevundimonas sp.]